MKRIQKLDDNVVNQIAAGEVVERPASVIKELVENSIDAGANKIEIEIAQGGRYLRVSDNGSGIHPDDIHLAFSRYATSKIETEKDLWTLGTLGFRGEALASILSISKLTCTTKTKDQENGLKAISLEDGSLEISSYGCGVGSTIEISDLFYNVPARLKFLKKPTTEIAAIVDVVQNLAIANPSVAFTCRHQNKIALKTSGSSELAICLGEIFSKDILNQLLFVNALDEKAKYFANGVITNPTFTRSNRKSIFLIINNRFVKCPILSKSIERAYEDMIPSGRFPLAVLNLMIPPDQVDVNVHPTKKEVKYSSTNSVFGFVVYSIKKALEEADFYKKPKEKDEKPEFKSHFASDKKEIETKQVENSIHNTPEQEELISAKPPKSTERMEPKPINKSNLSFSEAAIDIFKPIEPEHNKSIGQDVELEEISKQLPISEELKINTFKKKDWIIIGQAFNTFIILQTDNGLQIIDQHIASERAIYDELKRKEQQIACQRLFIPEEFDLNAETVELIEENSDHLKKNGFEIVIQNNNKAIIKQVPHIVSGKNYRSLFEEIINLLEKYSSIEILEDNILKTISCHAAVRAGDVLTNKEIEKIITNWQNSDYPFTCPHGRKICHNIDLKELSSFFDRQANYIGQI